INGSGRIGRNAFRGALGTDVEVVAVNDLAGAHALAHLLEYDSVNATLKANVKVDGDAIVVDGRRVQLSAERDPSQLRWGELGVDYVVESTGVFTSRDAAAAHLQAGAKKVIISAPAKGEDLTVVMGVNEDQYD